MELKNDDGFLLKCVKDCLGSEISKAAIYDCDNQKSVNIVSKLLDGVSFGKLTVALECLTDDLLYVFSVKSPLTYVFRSGHLLHTIKCGIVNELSLRVSEVSCSDPSASV